MILMSYIGMDLAAGNAGQARSNFFNLRCLAPLPMFRLSHGKYLAVESKAWVPWCGGGRRGSHGSGDILCEFRLFIIILSILGLTLLRILLSSLALLPLLLYASDLFITQFSRLWRVWRGKPSIGEVRGARIKKIDVIDCSQDHCSRAKADITAERCH